MGKSFTSSTASGGRFSRVPTLTQAPVGSGGSFTSSRPSGGTMKVAGHFSSKTQAYTGGSGGFPKPGHSFTSVEVGETRSSVGGWKGGNIGRGS